MLLGQPQGAPSGRFARPAAEPSLHWAGRGLASSFEEREEDQPALPPRQGRLVPERRSLASHCGFFSRCLAFTSIISSPSDGMSIGGTVPRPRCVWAQPSPPLRCVTSHSTRRSGVCLAPRALPCLVLGCSNPGRPVSLSSVSVPVSPPLGTARPHHGYGKRCHKVAIQYAID